MENDIVKLPHHCSYKSLGPDKGKDQTAPSENIAYMYEQKLSKTATLVSTSWPVPGDDENDGGSEWTHKKAGYGANDVPVFLRDDAQFAEPDIPAGGC